MYFIGLTIGHDSSLAIADKNGRIVFAVGEERFSRKKGHLGSPFESLSQAVEHLNISSNDLKNSTIVIGTKFSKNDSWFLNLLLNREHQENYDIFNVGLPPGLLKSFIDQTRSSGQSHQRLVANAFGFSEEKVHFLNHHDCHASSAFWPSNFNESLVVTLDGSGDGESGTLSKMSRNSNKETIYRIPERYSLGHIYSEVTKRYGFRESKHEGKITGLASYSSTSIAESEFSKLLNCRNGKLSFGWKYLLDPRNRDRMEMWRYPNHRKAIHLAVQRAEANSIAFPDLAAKVQSYLEKMVIELIEQNVDLSKSLTISLAGGVFSNVTLNKKIRDYFGYPIFVFPNMGDGGLSVGAIWEYMRLNSLTIDEDCVSNMYLGPTPGYSKSLIKKSKVDIHEIAKLIISNRVVGVIHGQMEFGPRALCHRSIVASPRNATINDTLNKRLNRTEFMPFAPVVREVDFHKVFEVSGANDFSVIPSNFHFMTETCEVREYWRNRIPAIVHVDNTARPQVLTEADNPLLYALMSYLSEHENLPVLINTSFNAHEEPIIATEDHAIKELQLGRIDVLISNGMKVEL